MSKLASILALSEEQYAGRFEQELGTEGPRDPEPVLEAPPKRKHHVGRLKSQRKWLQEHYDQLEERQRRALDHINLALAHHGVNRAIQREDQRVAQQRRDRQQAQRDAAQPQNTCTTSVACATLEVR
jgi:hypothetical protein